MMYLSDKLPRQNYSLDSTEFKDEFNKSQISNKKSQKAIKELSLPSIQNVKQIYMNNNSSELEASPAILAVSARRRNAKSLPKAKKNLSQNHSSIIKNESQSDSASVEGLKNEDALMIKEQLRAIGAQRNSLQLDILTEEKHSKLTERNNSVELKKLKTDSSTKNLEKRNELPTIKNTEKISHDYKGYQYNKSKSPALLKSKAQAAINS